MKKLLFAGLAAALSLVGCNKEADVKGLDAMPFEVVLNFEETRTVTEDGIHTKWAEGDKINVIHAEAGTTEYKHDTPDNKAYVVSDTETGVFKGTLQEGALEAGKSYDWYLFYPYSKYITSPVNTSENGGYVYVGGRSDQSQTQNGYNSRLHLAGGDKYGCFPLYGVVKNVPAATQPVVTMKHVASAIAINVKNATSDPITISEVAFTAPEAIIGQFYVSFDKEPLTFDAQTYSAATASVRVENPTALAAGETAILYMGIKPFTAKSGDKLSIKITADKGIVEKEITLPSNVQFKPGLVKTINVEYEAAHEAETSSLAEILEMATNSDVVTEEVLVVAKYARGIMLGQNGTFLLAFNNAGVNAAVGDIVTVSGKVGEYAGFKQIAEPSVRVISSGNEVVLPEPRVLANIDEYGSEKVELIQYTGTLKVSGNFYNVEVPGCTKKGSIQYPLNTDALNALKDKTIIATGFFTGITGSNTYVNMMSTSVEAAAVNAFNVTPEGEVNVAATATSLEIQVTGNVDWTAEASEGASIDKVSGNGDAVITVSFPANTDTEHVKNYSVAVRTEATGVRDEFIVEITQAKAVNLDGNLFVKVTDGLVSGQYLIVSEEGGVAMKDAVDVGGGANTISVTLENGVITATDALKAALFTFDMTTGFIQGPNGKYIGQTSDANGMKVQDNGLENSISISNGDADIVSGGAYLRYNANAGESNLRFRYYKSATYQNMKAIQLYKLSNGTAPTHSFGATLVSAQVGATDTEATVNVTGDVAWTASVSTGATVTPAFGNGAGTVKVSFPANTDTENTKTYTVTLSTLADVAQKTFELVITQDKAVAAVVKTLTYEESFANNSKGDFTIENVTMPSNLTYVWTTTKSYGMKASAYVSDTAYETESWLISPLVDLTGAVHPELTFSHAVNQFTSVASAQEETSVMVRIKGGSWTELTGVNYPANLGWTFVDSGSIDLSAYIGKQIQIGFKYTSTAAKAGTWEVKNFKLAEAATGPVDPTFTVAPTLNVEVNKTAKISVTTNSDGAVTYASANTSVATVAADGTVTGVAAGTTDVTVSVAATAAFNAKTATVAVTVTAPQTGSHYGRVTSITSGKKYLILGGGHPRVMIPLTTTTAGKAESEAVTINAGKIESNATTDSYAVTITKSGDDVSIVLPNGNYLVYASSTNIKGSATASDYWNVSEGTKGTFRFTSKATDTRGLIFRAGSSNQFGGYAVSNVTSTTNTEYFDIDLYELGAEPTVVSEVVLSSIAVSGQKTAFTVGDTFTFGGVVTATYSDGSTKDVTDDAVITAPDLSTAGTKNVTVSYTEKEDTKTTSYEVVVTSGSSSEDKVIIIDGSQLTSDLTTAETDKTYEGVTVAFSKGAKFQNCPSTATKQFAEKAILIGKKDAYIFNKDAIPGKIVKFEVYANKNASTAVTVGINFSDSAISGFNPDASNTFTATLNPDDAVYDCSDKLSANAKYFWFQVTNDKNAQVQFRITYE